eukprot:11277747-Heterocapsa_arctica.AAC.1
MATKSSLWLISVLSSLLMGMKLFGRVRSSEAMKLFDRESMKRLALVEQLVPDHATTSEAKVKHTV